MARASFPLDPPKTARLTAGSIGCHEPVKGMG